MDSTFRNGRKIAILAYVTIIGTAVAYFMNSEDKNEYAAFHVRQAFGIYLTFFILGYLISGFDSWPITFGFWMFIFILWFYGFLQALQGGTKPIPIMGRLFQKWFS